MSRDICLRRLHHECPLALDQHLSGLRQKLSQRSVEGEAQGVASISDLESSGPMARQVARYLSELRIDAVNHLRTRLHHVAQVEQVLGTFEVATTLPERRCFADDVGTERRYPDTQWFNASASQDGYR